MSNKRLIDGEALLSFMAEYRFESNFAKQLYAEIECGRFDSPSEEGEEARLREALERIQKLSISGLGFSIARSFKDAVSIAEQALSPHTEDTPEEPTRCGDCAHFSTPPYCKVFRQETEITAISCDSFVPDKSEDTGIQKVRERLTERFFKADGTLFVAYCGSKNPYNAALTIGEILISSKPREIIEEILERLAMYEDNILGITIPGITDGGRDS